MMRNALFFLAAWLVCLPVTGCRDHRKQEGKLLEGTWIPVEAELGGQAFPEAVLKTMKLTIKDGKYTVNVGGQIDNGAVKIESTTKPGAMDITGTDGPNKGKTFLAIYELKGDSLRICYDLEGRTRPTEFKTVKNTKQFLVNYKRLNS